MSLRSVALACGRLLLGAVRCLRFLALRRFHSSQRDRPAQPSDFGLVEESERPGRNATRPRVLLGDSESPVTHEKPNRDDRQIAEPIAGSVPAVRRMRSSARGGFPREAGAALGPLANLLPRPEWVPRGPPGGESACRGGSRKHATAARGTRPSRRLDADCHIASMRVACPRHPDRQLSGFCSALSMQKRIERQSEAWSRSATTGSAAAPLRGRDRGLGGGAPSPRVSAQVSAAPAVPSASSAGL
jgi:hypothetical protein